jgi:UDP-N-acetylmuramate--alanine ligase
MLEWSKSTKLHFIGIGGIGMSGIAEVLLDLGCSVSGSDLSSSAVTENLKKKGACVFQGHSAENVEGSTLVIYSSAIDKKNPEVARALELKIPMIRRAEMLAELMRLKKGIAVAGSHGKTTTTSLIATIFHEAKLDATHIIGGIVHNLGGNAKKGDGEFLIAEADESDGSFLQLSPVMAAVTNIDNDHLDHYGTEEKIVEAFVEFLNKLPFYGKAILNRDDKNSYQIKEKIKRPTLWFSKSVPKDEADFVATDVKLSAAGAEFNLHCRGKLVQKFTTHMLGQHNISNALAAIATCFECGIDWTTIQSGLLKFQGVGRRLERLYSKDNFVIIDDYGHHPTEVRATISALKDVDKRPLCIVFEPHRYTRTQNFWEEFQTCFDGADELFITPIYAASENPIPGITTEKLIEEMKKKGKKVFLLQNLDSMKELINERKNKEMIFLTLGAGAISKKAQQLVKDL